MKTIYSLAASLLCSLVFAQTTITKTNNDYISGNTVNENNVTGTPNNPAPTGSSQTFDNSALVKGSAITGTVSTPTAGETTTYPGTTVKFSDGNGNDIYYKSTATDLQITGATVGTAVLNFNTGNALFLKFPTASGDTYTNPASGVGNYNGTTAYFKGTITSNADAYGTLLIGGQSFANVTRVKTDQNYNIYLDAAFTVGPLGTIVSTIYTYYDNANRYPLFTVTSGTVSALGNVQTANAAVAQATVFLGVSDLAAKNNITVYPNPVQNQLFFGGDLSGFNQVKIYNMEGRLVKTQTIKEEQLNINTLPAGNYILQLSGKDKKAQSINIIKK